MYKLAPNNDGLIRLSDNAFIADGAEDDERDAWLSGGGVPAAADPPENWRELRAAEYPPMADYLDAIVKGDVAQQQAYISACLAVKVKYLKS